MSRFTNWGYIKRIVEETQLTMYIQPLMSTLIYELDVNIFIIIDLVLHKYHKNLLHFYLILKIVITNSGVTEAKAVMSSDMFKIRIYCIS